METKITIIYKGIKKEVEYPKTELQLKEIFDLINDNKFSESSNFITYLNNEQEEKIHNESLFNELNENSNEKVELILKKEVNPTKKSLLSNLINKYSIHRIDSFQIINKNAQFKILLEQKNDDLLQQFQKLSMDKSFLENEIENSKKKQLDYTDLINLIDNEVKELKINKENIEKELEEKKNELEEKKNELKIIKEMISKDDQIIKEHLKNESEFKKLKIKIEKLKNIKNQLEEETKDFDEKKQQNQILKDKIERDKKIMIEEKKRIENMNNLTIILKNGIEYNNKIQIMKDQLKKTINEEITLFLGNFENKFIEELNELKTNKIKKINEYFEEIKKNEKERIQFYNNFTKEYEESKKELETIMKLNNSFFGIECKICKETIKGIRYECSKCEEYNLCEKCELKNYIYKIHPITHKFYKIRKKTEKILINPKENNLNK